MNRTAFGSVLLAVLVVVGTAVPTMALSTSSTQASASDGQGTPAAMAVQDAQSSVNVTVGQQLSTVIGVSSDEVQTDFENTAFDISLERASGNEQTEAIAERADELRDRDEAISREYQAATEAYRDGELSGSEYAQRLAALNARASNLLDSYEQLQRRAANRSALELRAAGVDQSAIDAAVENLRSVSGTGTHALLEQFTGESEGEIRLETENGLSIEVESEDGERSREFERPRDTDDDLTVSQSDALETARAALSDLETGTWTLTGSTVKQDDGAFEFAFSLRNASELTGEAQVAVDGSSGTVFALDEEIDARGDEDDAEDDEDHEVDGDGELVMVVVEGTPAPNETIRVQVLADGDPADDVTVSLNDRAVGTTDADGTVEVALPASGEADLTARTADSDGGLEFEFGADDGDDVFRMLDVDATLDGDAVTATVDYDGDSVENASVYVNDRAVGTTDSDGTVAFTVDTTATERLELDVVKGAFEIELTYAIQDGKLVLTEEAHEGDGDKAEVEETDDEEDDERETTTETESETESTDDWQETDSDDETTETTATTEDDEETESDG
ncbi:DUF7096 domain-containing protein [Haloarchaeobius sp. HRN-SO-5]|uniref:DUF7096 domain-containing protein n=1 Tax=Haloarchaeobius sp. HRN-SO-5 TaxID=3446118 RepID=UPI003EC10B0F